MPRPWLPVHIDTATAMWRTGVTAAGIAKVLSAAGFFVSHNAVSSQLDRLGIPRPCVVAPWPEEHVATARRLWAEGRSGGDISKALAQLGFKASRSAVLGRLTRLGLLNKIPKGTTNRPRMTPRGTLERPLAPALRPKLLPATPDTIAAIEATLAPAADPFGKDGCRWPVGDPQHPAFRLCQRPKGTRRSGKPSVYCAEHHAYGHQPMKSHHAAR